MPENRNSHHPEEFQELSLSTLFRADKQAEQSRKPAIERGRRGRIDYLAVAIEGVSAALDIADRVRTRFRTSIRRKPPKK